VHRPQARRILSIVRIEGQTVEVKRPRQIQAGQLGDVRFGNQDQ
jgi:hypothetical protein